jgi:[acyl-carrier-protein] S-malonyltransferase
VRETLDEAADALGEDIARLIAKARRKLDLTTNTQPVMLTAGVACYRAWLAEGGAGAGRRRRPFARRVHRAGRGRRR